MARLLLALNWALTKAAFRRSVARTIGTIFGYVGALWFGVMLLLGVGALRWAPADLRGIITVAGLSLLVVLWTLATMLFFGVDQTLDPGRFAVLPVRARQLMPGLLLIGFLGAGGMLLLFLLAGFVVAFSGSPLALVAAIVSGLVGVTTILLLGRVATSAFARALSSRKTRDLAVLVLGLSGVLMSVAGQSVGPIMRSGNLTRIRSAFEVVATVASWTPMGWAWAVPADVEAGRWLSALAHLGLAVGLLAGLWFAWAHFLDRALTSPLEAGGTATKVKAGGRIDRLFPASPAGAIAARSVRYWRRDPRHLLVLAMMVLMPFLLLVPLFANMGHELPVWSVLGGPPMMAMLVGSAMATETAYDGTALATHVVSGIRGIEDRLGRALGVLAVVGPLLVLAWVIASVAARRADLSAGSLGVTLALVGAGLGAGAWTSTYWNQPQPPPGANPFQKNTGGSMAGLLSVMVVGALTWLPSLPAIGLLVAGFWFPWAAWVALPVGLLTGGLMAWWGLVAGGKRLDHRWPEVLKSVTYEG